MLKNKKIMYKATDNKGKIVYDYIEASSNKELVTKLNKQGYKNIDFYENDMLTQESQNLDNMTSKLQRKQAELDIKMLIQPTFWSYFTGSVRLLKSNQIILMIALVILAMGLYYQQLFFIILAAVITLYVPYIIWKDYIFYDDIKYMNKAYAEGDFKEAMRIVSLYKSHTPKMDDEYTVVFDVMQALIETVELSSEDAYTIIAKKYIHLKKTSSLHYDFLLLDVLIQKQKYADAIENLDKLLEDYPDNNRLMLMKMSLLIYLEKDINIEEILENINVDNLEMLSTRALYYYIKGKLYQDDKKLSLKYFRMAKEIYDIENLNPYFAIEAAQMRVSYAYALCQNGQKNEVDHILKKEWKIFNTHNNYNKDHFLKCFQNLGMKQYT